MYGGLVLYYPTPRNIQPEEIELASAFASNGSSAFLRKNLTLLLGEHAGVMEVELESPTSPTDQVKPPPIR